MQDTNYRVINGPESYLPPAAASMGVVLPDRGQSLIEGRIVAEKEAMEKIAEKLLSANCLPAPNPYGNWLRTNSRRFIYSDIFMNPPVTKKSGILYSAMLPVPGLIIF